MLTPAGPIALPAEQGTAALRVRVLGTDGEPVQAVYLNLWRAIDPAHKDTKTTGLYASVYWDDRAAGRTWERSRNWDTGSPPRKTLGFEDLPAGEYRVSAATHGPSPTPDPTPFGVSDIVRLADGERKEVTARLAGDTPLTVRVAELGSDVPLEAVAVRLVRGDGLPVVHGHGSGNFFERTDGRGEVRFRKLVPGEYSLVVMGKWAWSYGEVDFDPPERPVPIRVVAGRDNRADVRLRGRLLSEAEIAQRWPFVVQGRVTDDVGRPVPGVEVTAATGIGTLGQTGRTLSGPDGRYTLRFNLALGTPVRAPTCQAAIISARRPGYYERDLNRHGDLRAAKNMTAKQAREASDRGPTLMPDTPHTLNFVMLPAAVVEGRLADGAGKPLAGRWVYVTGPHRPPGQSVVVSAETDRDGRFRYTSVPTGTWRFQVREGRDDVESADVRFDRPVAYTAEVVLDGARLSATLTAAQ